MFRSLLPPLLSEACTGCGTPSCRRSNRQQTRACRPRSKVDVPDPWATPRPRLLRHHRELDPRPVWCSVDERVCVRSSESLFTHDGSSCDSWNMNETMGRDVARSVLNLTMRHSRGLNINLGLTGTWNAFPFPRLCPQSHPREWR